MPEAITVRDLHQRERPAFIAVMGEAFKRDPLFVAAFGAPDINQRVLPQAFLAFLFDMNRLLGGAPRGLFVDGRLTACALLEPPAAGPVVNGLRQIGVALRFLPLTFRMKWRSIAFFNRAMRLAAATAPPAPHCYLRMIGVHPDGQGHGHGRRLMEDAIEHAQRDPRATGIALDTENDANVALYARWGFTLLASVDLGAATVHCMFRPVQPHRPTKTGD